VKREHCQQDKHWITLPLWQHHTPSVVIIKVITMGQKLAVMVIQSWTGTWPCCYLLPHLCFTLWESMTTTDNVSHDSITIVIPFTVGWTTGRAVEACTGLKLAGFPRLPRDSHGFVLIHCGNPATMGLMSQESHGYGMGRLRESRGVDRLSRDVISSRSYCHLAVLECQDHSVAWMAEVTRRLSGVPATSTYSERSLSLAWGTLEERRMQLEVTMLIDCWSCMDLMTDYWTCGGAGMGNGDQLDCIQRMHIHSSL